MSGYIETQFARLQLDPAHKATMKLRGGAGGETNFLSVSNDQLDAIKSVLTTPKHDPRFTVGYEFVGPEKDRHAWALRFCGDLLSYHNTMDAAHSHIQAIETAPKVGRVKGWKLLARTGFVLWLKRGKTHRVAYGAYVEDYTGPDADIEAAQRFGLNVAHELQCNGEMED